MNDYKLVSFKDGRATFSFEIKLSENRWIDKDTGYLYCDNAIFGHTGVQEYYGYELGMDLEDDKIVKVHRFAEDVFSDEAMASIEGKSLTILHPKESVNNKNYKDLEVGTILKVWREGENVVGKIVVKDMEAIEAITEGRYQSLSLGYRATLEPIKDGKEYKQTKLYINHLALVSKGRAKNARIMDEDINLKDKEKKSMGLFDWLIGKRIKPNSDGSIEILKDEEKVVEEEVKVNEEKVEDTKVEEIIEQKTVVDEKPKEEINKEKEENLEMTKEEMQAFRDELKAELLEEMKAKSKTVVVEDNDNVFKKTEVVETVKIEDEDSNVIKLSLDFKRDEELKKIYYDMYTNPMAHGGSFKELEAFRKKANSIVVR